MINEVLLVVTGIIKMNCGKSLLRIVWEIEISKENNVSASSCWNGRKLSELYKKLKRNIVKN